MEWHLIGLWSYRSFPAIGGSCVGYSKTIHLMKITFPVVALLAAFPSINRIEIRCVKEN